MLTRFYDVTEGSVLIDNHDVRDVTIKSLREEVGVLMQDPFIFHGSVIENIRYGRLLPLIFLWRLTVAGKAFVGFRTVGIQTNFPTWRMS